MQKLQKIRVRLGVAVAAIVLSLGLVLTNGVANAVPGTTARVSTDSSGGQSNAYSSVKGITKDGNNILLFSSATNLVGGDTNAVNDWFLKDKSSGAIERINVSSSEVEANDASADSAAMSQDGRYVVFDSNATNLVSGDTNGKSDVFLRDVQTGTTEIISVSSSEVQGNNHSYNGSVNSVSNDGRFVVFQSTATDLVSGDTNGKDDIFIRDRTLGTTQKISLATDGTTQGNGHSYSGMLSCDGRFIVYASQATNLVSGDTNAVQDTFLYDQLGSVLTNITINANGSVTAVDVTCNANYILLTSGNATNLVTGDTNGAGDAFVYKRTDSSITRASLADDESEGNANSSGGSVSEDGRYVAFLSSATNIISGDTNAKSDAFLRDMQSGTTTRVSVDSSGNQANDATNSSIPLLSADGHLVAYESIATNLVGSDTNAVSDVFVTDTGNGSNACAL